MAPVIWLDHLEFIFSLKSNCPDLWHFSKLFFYTGQLSSDDSYALNTLGVITKNLSFLLDSVPFEFPYFTNGIFSKFIPFRLSELGFDAMWFDSDQICINDISPVIMRSTSDHLFVDGGIKVSGQFRDTTRGVIASSQYSDINFDASGICGNFYLLKKHLPIGTTDNLINHFLRLADNLYLEQGVTSLFSDHHCNVLFYPILFLLRILVIGLLKNCKPHLFSIHTFYIPGLDQSSGSKKMFTHTGCSSIISGFHLVVHVFINIFINTSH